MRYFSTPPSFFLDASCKEDEFNKILMAKIGKGIKDKAIKAEIWHLLNNTKKN